MCGVIVGLLLDGLRWCPGPPLLSPPPPPGVAKKPQDVEMAEVGAGS